ncbi:response regulator transcription factor [Magnetospirillum molischianum]|uniref:Putative two-component response transcriptional regulator (LuxR family) n=1 Tax=Magnetospirillum molischianum DSM 120 TaxID=1150626 RepID=H8FR45_MAGML|nr:response regulator transcription factor [Magnetospirillum molischianum]CCG40833.1 Putative two-component response transcriptional regulator (LuxR family) [Magnetospirillum molischianum DSM 120]
MKLLLADDHSLFREGIRMVLESLAGEPLTVVEASDFPQVLARVRTSNDIDVALVDLSMPGMDGLSAIGAIRRAAPDLYLVVVSASEDPQVVRRALDAGAHGYISKSAGSAEMMKGIRSVLEGDIFVAPPVSAAEAVPAKPGDFDAERLRALLTPRQRDVLAMLRQGKSNKEVARDLSLAEITVKLHVTAILRSLGCENRTQAAILAARMGL